MHKMILMISTLAFSVFAHAQGATERYSGIARDKKGDVAYQERHEVILQQGQVQTAKTRYIDASGNPIGEMISNFKKSLTLPEYSYEDFRSQTSHGIKLTDEKVTLWSKDREGKMESSDFSRSQFSPEMLLVGCQGLHYYLVANLDHLKKKKSVPIAYFIPGKLDYFKFTLNFDREDDEYVYLTLSIDNVFLKLFTSSLNLQYRKSDRKLIQFAGLSNITDAKNKLQNVIIGYSYE